MRSRWRGWRLAARLGWVPLASGLAACGRLPQSTFDPAGPVAASQLRLLNLSMWIMIAVFAIVAAILTYVVVRFRERPGQQGLPPQVEGNHRLEVLWTAGPILVLALLAVPTVRDVFALARTPEGGDALRVRVVGHQWWWEFQYPDLGIVTANELVIPAGRKVSLTLTSADVIHSFWVPRLAGKMDLVPGRENSMWIQADEPGTYSGQCAEFCGTSHANMRFLVVARPAAEFDAWVKGQQNPVVEPQTDLARRGQEIFGQKCVACHAIRGTPFTKGAVGPNLTGVGSRQTIAAGMLPNTDENLRRWLDNPSAVKPNAKMPDYNLNEQEIDALIAYLRGLK